MTKISWKPGTMLSPLPPALISSADENKKNIMTAAWTGIICSDPVITYVSIRPSRYSHELISKSKEFVINLPTWQQASLVDTVGVKSGRDIDKFALTGFTALPSTKINAPQIAECPVSMECKVLEIKSYGTHDMFLAEVVAVNVDDKYIDETGALDLEKAGLLAYAHGFYYTLGRKIGKFGFSVEKKKTTNKKTIEKSQLKFSKEKTEVKFTKKIEESTLESGVKVVKKNRIVKKSPINKEEKPTFTHKKVENKNTSYKKTEEKDFSRKKTFSKPQNKFQEKGKKNTSYEPYSFKKKSDGGFKKKLPPRNK